MSEVQPPVHPQTNRFGGFHVGDMELALPLASLKEVVPLGALTPLPCANTAVLGGLNLRGLVVPVMDIRLALGRASRQHHAPCVVIVAQDAHLLGMLADGISGVFEAAPQDLRSLSGREGNNAWCQGTLVRPETGAMVSVLSPAGMLAMPDLPWVAAPHAPSTPSGDIDDVETSTQTTHLPLMLMRCGRHTLAIEALSVSATLRTPDIQPSALAMGHCKGVIDHAGMIVPAVDLGAMLGLEQVGTQEMTQAFVLHTPQGCVAFLISEVLDVVACPAESILHVPKFALPSLCKGTVPMHALPGIVAQRCAAGTTQFMLIDADALRAEQHIDNLASTVRNIEAAPPSRGEPSRPVHSSSREAPRGRAALTFLLESEAAVPLDQVEEILPYTLDEHDFASNGSLLGVLINRGRSIPVVCLNQLAGRKRPTPTPASAILVVRSRQELIGFAVAALRSIESPTWSADTPTTAEADASDLKSAMRCRELLKVGQPGQERLLPLLDLVAIARALQQAEVPC